MNILSPFVYLYIQMCCIYKYSTYFLSKSLFLVLCAGLFVY